MRVLLSCLQSPIRHAVPAYEFWRNYFLYGLREAGHEVVEVPNVDWAEGLTCADAGALNRWRARTWGAVDDFVRREHACKPIHLFLGYLFPQQVEPAAIRELQRKGIPCVNFFCDNIRDFDKVPAAYQPFALHWVPEFEALPMYRRAGLPYIHAAMPCWVPAELRSLPSAESAQATFVGSADELRRDLLGRALDGGADFVIHGVGWLAEESAAGKSKHDRTIGRILQNQINLVRERGWIALTRKLDARLRPLRSPPILPVHLGSAVSDAEYIRLARESIVTIGVNRVPTATRSPRKPLVYSRLRDIEAPMLGACYLTEWTAGLERLYELGAEIECYRTADELSEKLNELRRDPARRAGMRARAQTRALSEHSVARSIARIAEHFRL